MTALVNQVIEVGGETKGRAPRGGRSWAFGRQRLGFYLFTIWAAVTLNFFIPRFIPGDPAQALVDKLQEQTGQPPSLEELAAIRRFYGNPRADLFHQYVEYWHGVVTFNFGASVSNYPTPVSQLIGKALPWTLALVGTTTLLAWAIGTMLGVLLGWRPGGRLDSMLTPLSTFLHAIPAFWLALMAYWAFAFKFGWFPLGGGYNAAIRPAFNVRFLSSALHYGALPAICLVFVGLNGWLFGMRNMMVTTIGEDYVLFAKAKGLSRSRVIFRYAARNAMLPNITSLAMAMSSVIGGALVTEIVFTYPGVGNLLFQAVQNKDYPVMQGIFFTITIVALVANLLADAVYVLMDPRTRATA